MNGGGNRNGKRCGGGEEEGDRRYTSEAALDNLSYHGKRMTDVNFVRNIGRKVTSSSKR